MILEKKSDLNFLGNFTGKGGVGILGIPTYLKKDFTTKERGSTYRSNPNADWPNKHGIIGSYRDPCSNEQFVINLRLFVGKDRGHYRPTD